MRKCKDCGAILGEYDIVCSNCSCDKSELPANATKEEVLLALKNEYDKPHTETKAELNKNQLKSPDVLKYVANVFLITSIFCIVIELFCIVALAFELVSLSELGFPAELTVTTGFNAISYVFGEFSKIEFFLVAGYAIFKALEEIVLGIWRDNK